jgi:hypothetical protein
MPPFGVMAIICTTTNQHVSVPRKLSVLALLFLAL